MESATKDSKGKTDLPGGLGADYAPPGEERPLAGYTVLVSAFTMAFVGALFAARRRGRDLPERPSAYDVALIGVATHKLSRLVAKDRVTSFVRAPFTRYQGSAGHGKLEEEARGTGLRKSIGELLICPYCLAQWVAAAFTVGLVVAPRLTRLLAGMWSAHALADGIQLAYSAAEKRS